MPLPAQRGGPLEAGDGFHTLDEHVLISSLIPRARLFSGLLRTLA